MSVLEVEIEQRVVDWARARGFLTPKVKFVENGYPDRLFISPYGHTIFIEFKRPGDKPRQLQEYRLNELQRRGIPATWTDSSVEGINILKAALESAQLPEKSNTDAVGAGVRGALPGPWVGENLNGSGCLQDTQAAAVSQEDVNRSSPASGLQGVAGRDKEVGGLPESELQYLARDKKAGKFE